MPSRSDHFDLPIVDWALIGTDAEVELVQKWGTSLASFGFVIIRNSFAKAPPEAKQSLTKLERAARTFFEENSFSVKRQFQLEKVYTVQGYGGPGEINVSGGSTIRQRAPDAVETIHCACMVDELDKTATAVVPNRSMFLHPEGLPISGSDDCELRDADAGWYRTAHEELAEKALLLTRKYLGISEEGMRRAMEGGAEMDMQMSDQKDGSWIAGATNIKTTDNGPPLCFGRVSINRYLPFFQENQLCYGEHVDSSLLTFVWRSSWNGLQFLRKGTRGEADVEEEWIDVPHDEDFIVVNAGATLEAMTNGHIKGVIHRVLGPHHKNAAAEQRTTEAAVGAVNSPVDGDDLNKFGLEFAPKGWPVTVAFFLHPANDAMLHPFKSALVEKGLDDKYVDPITGTPFTSSGLRKHKIQRTQLDNKTASRL